MFVVIYSAFGAVIYSTTFYLGMDGLSKWFEK